MSVIEADSLVCSRRMESEGSQHLVGAYEEPGIVLPDRLPHFGITL